MKFYKQLHKHDPDNGVWGDCHRTAIGCLLDIEPELIPNFYEEHKDSSPNFIIRCINEYLCDIGYYMVSFSLASDTAEGIMDWMQEQNPNLYYMLTGKSKNNVGHVVICCNDKIIHDPSLDNSGIVGPVDNDTFIIEVLVPMSQVRS